MVEGSLQLRLLLFQLRQAVCLLLHLGLDGLCLLKLAGILLGLAHQHADLLGDGIAVGAQLIRLGDGGTALGVQFDDLIHQGQLGVLEFLLDVFFDSVGIFPDKLDIQHGSILLVGRFPAKPGGFLLGMFHVKHG